MEFHACDACGALQPYWVGATDDTGDALHYCAGCLGGQPLTASERHVYGMLRFLFVRDGLRARSAALLAALLRLLNRLVRTERTRDSFPVRRRRSVPRRPLQLLGASLVSGDLAPPRPPAFVCREDAAA